MQRTYKFTSIYGIILSCNNLHNLYESARIGSSKWLNIHDVEKHFRVSSVNFRNVGVSPEFKGGPLPLIVFKVVSKHMYHKVFLPNMQCVKKKCPEQHKASQAAYKCSHKQTQAGGPKHDN